MEPVKPTRDQILQAVSDMAYAVDATDHSLDYCRHAVASMVHLSNKRRDVNEELGQPFASDPYSKKIEDG